MRPRACASLSVIGAAALLTACGGEAQPEARQNARDVRAELLTSVSPAHCVQSLAANSSADPVRCPAPLRNVIAEATTTCREAGGTLLGVPEGVVWGIDVNGDGRQELAFELDGNVACEGAWSIFSCGSLGCAKGLYELRDGAWAFIGGLSASAPERIALEAATASDGHRNLEVCAQDDCAVRWIYEWLGSAYDSTRGEVRGAGVDIANSIHGLYPLVAATTVLAEPKAGAADVGRYDAGTEMAIIGTAENADYYYVSPCNACESGFVAKSAVATP